MSQLRSDTTQAIAQALWSKVQDEYDDEWADIALDALLDYLETHTEEWSAEYWNGFPDDTPARRAATKSTISGLLAVLRVEP